MNKEEGVTKNEGIRTEQGRCLYKAKNIIGGKVEDRKNPAYREAGHFRINS